MALFGDLSWQGSAEQVDFVFGGRERHAQTLQIWIDAFNAVSGKAPEEARAVLQKVLDSENRCADADSLAISAREGIAALIQVDDNTHAFSDRVAALKQYFERQCLRALRHKTR